MSVLSSGLLCCWAVVSHGSSVQTSVHWEAALKVLLSLPLFVSVCFVDVGAFYAGRTDTYRCHIPCGSRPFIACAVLLFFKGENSTNSVNTSFSVVTVSLLCVLVY